MKSNFVITGLILLISYQSSSQRIQSPTWSTSFIYFETAKISKYNEATKKWGSEVFKTSKISIDNANLSTPTITIDIPDIFFIKEGQPVTIRHEQDNFYGLGTESITYILKDEKDRIAGITFRYALSIDMAPTSITLSFFKNYPGSISNVIQYSLSELK